MHTTLLFPVYRASFPKTFKEIRAGDGHYRIVIPAVLAGLGIAYVVQYLLKTTGKYV